MLHVGKGIEIIKKRPPCGVNKTYIYFIYLFKTTELEDVIYKLQASLFGIQVDVVQCFWVGVVVACVSAAESTLV